jgi:four helix bundle protein
VPVRVPVPVPVPGAQRRGWPIDKSAMSSDGHLLDHERLDVYRCAIEFVRVTFELLGRLPPTERELRDQWKRAAMSIALNIAEGGGKPSEADRARFRAIARGSAMECGALLDVACAAGFLGEAEAAPGKTLLVRIVAMLTRMCR